MVNTYTLITGASRGLGRAIAIDQSLQKKNLVLHFNSGESAVNEVRKECERNGSKVLTVQANLTETEGIAKLMAFIKEEGIKLSGLVNNAGSGGGGGIKEVTADVWDRVLDLNLRAPVLLTQQLLPYLEKGAAVVNISSGAGIKNGISSIAYESSKAGLIHATRSMALSLAPDVRVNSIAPGFVKTDINKARWGDPNFEKMVVNMTPVGRWGEPVDIAKSVSFLLSEDSSFICGETLVVDGGITIR